MVGGSEHKVVLDESGFRAYCGDVDWGSNFLSVIFCRAFISNRQLFFLQACHVIICVPDHNADQCPRPDDVSAGGAASQSGFISHVVDGENVGAAQMFKLLKQILEWMIIKTSFAHIIIGLKAREWSRIIS